MFWMVGSVLVKGQAQSATPAPGAQKIAIPRGTTSTSRGDATGTFSDLRSMEIKQVNVNDLEMSRQRIEETIYRKPTKEEIRLLEPSARLVEKYAAFLRQPNTGIIKLNASAGCGENPNVIVAKEKCLQNPIPGAGSAFSFRTESYRLPQLSDLILSSNVLKTDGVLQQGILARIGDVALENLSLETAGMKYLIDFRPAENLMQMRENDLNFSKGVRADGFIYGMGFYVDDKNTFALRSIAYKGKVERSVSGITYNELDFDKRKDIIVGFRVVEKNAAGDITILWKILSRRDSPTIKTDTKKQ